MSNSHKNEGVLYLNRERTSDKHPTYKGYVTVSLDQLKMLKSMLDRGLEPKLQVAAWPRVAKSSGDKYVYLATETYLKEGGQAARPARAPAPASDGFDDLDIPF